MVRDANQHLPGVLLNDSLSGGKDSPQQRALMKPTRVIPSVRVYYLRKAVTGVSLCLVLLAIELFGMEAPRITIVKHEFLGPLKIHKVHKFNPYPIQSPL